VATRAEIALRRTQAEALLNLSRIQRALERRIQALLDEQGLENVTPAQANALIILFQEKRPMTARQLARMMNLSEVTVGRFVRALENGAWVERDNDPSDSRAILISPSGKARRAFQRFLRVSNAVLENSFIGFSRKDVAHVMQATDKIARNLDEESGSAR
jgi:DNA-binding MarR family transcriptional regulator